MAHFTLRASRLLAAGFTAIHAASAAVTLPLQLPVAAKAVLWAAIAASLTHALLRHAFLLTANAIVAGVITDASLASFTRHDGREVDAEILDTTYVTPSLTLLNLREQGAVRPRHVILVRDNVEVEDFRELRVVLRWVPRSAA